MAAPAGPTDEAGEQPADRIATPPVHYDAANFKVMLTKVAAPPAAEAVVDADTGELIPRELGGFVVHQRAKDGYVNATAMCKAAGKLIGDWSQNAGTKKVLASLSRIMGIPIIELAVSKVGGNIPEEQRGTWVHPKVAIHLATWCSSDFFAQVIEWVHDWVVEGKPAQPQLPDLRDPDVLLRLVHDTSGKLLEARGAIDKLVDLNIGLAQENIVLEGDKEQLTQANVKAVAKKVEAESVAAELARLAAMEAEALPLSAWIARNTHIHGHGPNIGLKMMRASGRSPSAPLACSRTSRRHMVRVGQSLPRCQPTRPASSRQTASRRTSRGRKKGGRLNPPKPQAVLLDVPDVREACNLEAGADVATPPVHYDAANFKVLQLVREPHRRLRSR